jgi:hypothetical protein
MDGYYKTLCWKRIPKFEVFHYYNDFMQMCQRKYTFIKTKVRFLTKKETFCQKTGD